MSPRPARAVLVLATLVAGCASLPPPTSIEGLASLAGTSSRRTERSEA